MRGAMLDFMLATDTQSLNEVVVGYGTQKRQDVTGSVTSVPQDRLDKIPVANVTQAIQGAVAGVQVTTGSSVPGAQASIRIRGVRSITANTDPCIILDGVPLFPGNLNDISPNDLADIEILKDASATAIYGTRGSNGVILVTTKRGKTGKPQIRYAGYAGPEYQVNPLMPLSGEEYLAKYRAYTRQANITPQTTPYSSELPNYNAGFTTGWLKEVAQRGSIQDHNVSISGGTDDVKYYVSGGHYADMFVVGNQRRNQGNQELIWGIEQQLNVPGGYNLSGTTVQGGQQRRVWVPGYYNITGMLIADSLGGRGIGRMRLSQWMDYQLFSATDMRNSKYNLKRRFYYNDPGKTALYGKRVIVTGSDTSIRITPYITKWNQYNPLDEFGLATIKDLPMMRLGETYLLQAEAQLK